MNLRYTRYESPIGELTLLCDGQHLTGISINPIVEGIPRDDDHPVLNAAKHWLSQYFDKKSPSPDELPLAPQGTDFQKLVWSLLLQVSFGEWTTYGALAKQVAAKLGSTAMSAQAIGNAVGKNPILIVIPCHRVLGVGSRITGFSAGIEKKIQLLKLENIPHRD